MNTRVSELLDKIDEKYPRSRREKCRHKWQDLWSLDTPFTVPPIALHRGRYADGAGHPRQHSPGDRQKLLVTMLDDIVHMGDIDDDYLPVLTLDSGAYILAEAFGGQPVYMNNMYSIEKFLTTPDDVKNLHPFDPEARHRYMDMVFETLAFFRDETAGRIPINIHTPQGPLETLGCMWDSNVFYLTLLDEPEIIHQVLKKIVTAYIWYIRRQMEILGEDLCQISYAMSYTHRPFGSGIGVGEDVISTIGSDSFSLTLPIYRAIADEFGPVFLHSCGNPSQQLATVMANPMIAGIHFSQLNAEDFMPQITRPLVLHSRNDWTDFEQFRKYAAVARQYNMRIAYQFQSLGNYMQVGSDWSCYNPELMNKLFVEIQCILNEIYDL